jgi:plastocyanin
MKTYTAKALANLHLPQTSSLRRIFCLGFLIWTHSATWAATSNVDIEPFAFNPNNVTINVNDQVVWTWVSDFHNTVSDAALWDSGVHSTGFTFAHTFTSTGTFPYHCTVHGFPGTVNVQGGTTSPTVAISSPTNGASFAAPASVPITATATDADVLAKPTTPLTPSRRTSLSAITCSPQWRLTMQDSRAHPASST